MKLERDIGIPAAPPVADSAVCQTDRITWVKLSLAYLPLAMPISDAKVLTGRQKPLTQVAFVFAEIATANGHSGLGFG